MRRLVLVLVLANVLMFGWNRGWFDGAGRSSARDVEENAHRLRPVPLSRLEARQSARTPAPRASHAPGPSSAQPPIPSSPSPQAPPQSQAPASPSPASPSQVPVSPQPSPPASTPSSGAPAPEAKAPSMPAPGETVRTPVPEPGSTAAVASPAAFAPAVCRAFPPIDEERAAALRSALEQSGARVEARRIEQGSSYLVYLPPASSVAETQQRLVELRRLGRDDAFVIQDGSLRMAISLGLFRFESAARSMVEQLARAGETRALVAPRPPIQVRIALRASWSQPQGGDVATMLGAQFDAPARDCE